MTPAQRVMKIILENHRPIDIGEGDELKFATTVPASAQMKAYYPPKKPDELMLGMGAQPALPGGMNGILPNSGT